MLAPGIVTVFLLMQACAKQKPEAQASCNFIQNGASQRVSWKADTPAELYIHESVPMSYTSAVEAAVAEWNSRAGRTLIRLIPGRVGGGSSPKKDGYSVLYMMNSWESNKRTEQARTTIYWSGSRIYEADIRLNDKNFNFVVGEAEGTFYGVDLESLLIHELGHFLGLAHTHSRESVMYKSLASGDVRDHISDEDLDSLMCEY